MFAVGDTEGEFSLICGVRREDDRGQSEEPDVLVGSRIIIKALCISLSLRCDGSPGFILGYRKNIIL